MPLLNDLPPLADLVTKMVGIAGFLEPLDTVGESVLEPLLGDELGIMFMVTKLRSQLPGGFRFLPTQLVEHAD